MATRDEQAVRYWPTAKAYAALGEDPPADLSVGVRQNPRLGRSLADLLDTASVGASFARAIREGA